MRRDRVYQRSYIDDAEYIMVIPPQDGVQRALLGQRRFVPRLWFCGAWCELDLSLAGGDRLNVYRGADRLMGALLWKAVDASLDLPVGCLRNFWGVYRVLFIIWLQIGRVRPPVSVLLRFFSLIANYELNCREDSSALNDLHKEVALLYILIYRKRNFNSLQNIKWAIFIICKMARNWLI